MSSRAKPRDLSHRAQILHRVGSALWQRSFDFAQVDKFKARSIAVLSLLFLASQGFAQQYGTKKDVLAGGVKTTPAIGFMPFLQMMVALAIVFAIMKFLLPKAAAFLNKKLVTNGGSQIQIEESAGFAGGNLYVVSVRGKTLLLSAGQTGVTCLADLTDARPQVEKPLFMDILDKEQQSPSNIYVEPTGEPTPIMRAPMADDEIQAALDRLNKLGGA